MSYYTDVSGKIRISPPITWPEMKTSPFVDDDNLDVRLDIEVETVDTSDGELIRRTAYDLIPATDEAYRVRHLVEDVQKAIDAFPGHVFTGTLHCDGEDSSDLWRVVVCDGRAVKVEPRIVWPDEEVQR